MFCFYDDPLPTGLMNPFKEFDAIIAKRPGQYDDPEPVRKKNQCFLDAYKDLTDNKSMIRLPMGGIGEVQRCVALETIIQPKN